MSKTRSGQRRAPAGAAAIPDDELLAQAKEKVASLQRASVTPHRAIATAMRGLRNSQRWSAERLAEKMTEVGIPWDKSIVANFELGRRASISVEEWLALAYVLDVAPVHLLVPYEDDAVSYRAVPSVSNFSAGEVRDWVRGEEVIGGVDPVRYGTRVPASWKKPDAHGLMHGVVADAFISTAFGQDVRTGKRLPADGEATDGS